MQVTSSEPSIRFEGTGGWLGNTGWQGQLMASDTEIYRRVYEPAKNRIWPRPPSEHRNFLDAIQTGKAPTYSAEALHRMSTVLHMGAIAMELNRPLNWDTTTESFDDTDANALRSRPSRELKS